jgi:hypothetical protein
MFMFRPVCATCVPLQDSAQRGAAVFSRPGFGVACHYRAGPTCDGGERGIERYGTTAQSVATAGELLRLRTMTDTGGPRLGSLPVPPPPARNGAISGMAGVEGASNPGAACSSSGHREKILKQVPLGLKMISY